MQKLLLIAIISLLYSRHSFSEDSSKILTPAEQLQYEQFQAKIKAAEVKEREDSAHLQDIVNQAFNAAKTEQLPLSPAQIDEYQDRIDKTGAAIFPSPPPKMISRTQSVSLEPGAIPVTVRLASGYVSSIIVIDSTGQPWPITSATVGNDKFFSVLVTDNGEKNMLTINALRNHVSSNIAVTLAGRDAPLIIELKMHDDSVNKAPQEADMLVSMRMNKQGPKAEIPTFGAKIKSPVSSELMSFLDGVPATGATIVKLRNPPDGVQAWALRGQMYLRTPHLARWPAWVEQASSSSGMTVYVMPMVSQVLLSVNGASLSVAVIQ